MARRRFSSKPPTVGPLANRKALQLCRQVERALQVGLAGDTLRDLAVQSVRPAPDSSRLLVTFALPESIPPVEALAAIEQARGKLRGTIAAAIHRKKTPELAFQLVRG